MSRIIKSLFKRNNTCIYKPVNRWLCSNANTNTILDEDLAIRLETVSHVGFSKHSGFEVLSSSVKFADRITLLDTINVEPLVTVLETWYVPMINKLLL